MTWRLHGVFCHPCHEKHEAASAQFTIHGSDAWFHVGEDHDEEPSGVRCPRCGSAQVSLEMTNPWPQPNSQT